MRIPKQTPAIFHNCRGYSFVGGASNSGFPTRYLRDPVEDLIQRIVTAVRTIPCQEEIYVQAGILQLGGESNRYREGRVSVAGAVSHISVRRIRRLGIAHENHRIHQDNIAPDFICKHDTVGCGAVFRETHGGAGRIAEFFVLTGSPAAQDSLQDRK